MKNTTGTESGVVGGLVDAGGETWYRIDGVERMEPFLTTVVSDDDLWMFVSSAGPLTAGRVDADHAFLPYETDDRLHRAAGITGPVTVIAREVDGVREVWRPYARECEPGCSRSMAKHELGTALVMEETNAGWGLTYRVTWAPSPRYGWVRRVDLVDDSGEGAAVEVLDGLIDVMPTGVDASTEQHTSNLVDAYKRSETGRWGTVAVYSLQSLITDRAEPAEALAATVIWSTGLPDASIHLDERAIADVTRGSRPQPVDLLTGRRGSYLLHADVTVAPGDVATWHMVADVGLGHADVVDRVSLAADPKVVQTLDADIEAGTERLRRYLVGADGFQATADPIADAHHLSNVLFNCMRGGVFPYAYDVPTTDLAGFVRDRNREVAERHADLLAGLPENVDLAALHEQAEASGDPDLLRLVLEYLPLTFSRRHGDPSRPWNRFAIRVRAADGSELLTYQGNWRDIFQNWEALLRSYPLYFPHVVAKFVNATTPDGHNAYRISRDGIDWEVPDEDDPWSNIGYWGDHQIIYLLRLLEGWQAVDPDGIDGWLDRALFTYADVPYRLADHEAMVAAPRDTITFDEEAEARVAERVREVGADGRLVAGDDGLARVTFLEKLLVPALAKLSSYVPGGGIWMNTQRPEWNDANNALAGYGLSMVTLYHLDRYVRFVRRIVDGAGSGPVSISRPVADWVAAISAVLADHPAEAGIGDRTARRRVLDALGRAGASYRNQVRDGFDTTPSEVDPGALVDLLDAAAAHLRATIADARRPDGLYDAYNLVAFPTEDEATVQRLAPMLEGQVAAIGSTALSAEDVIDLVESMYASELYRADQRTFLLYPAHRPPAFLDRNTVPPEVVAANPFLRELVGNGSAGVLHEDSEGGLHFRPGLANAAALDAALEGTALDQERRALVHRVYEEMFGHHAFTGRSSGMYGYEGIGSIYWHMVSKLLLAVQERYLDEVRGDARPDVLAGLAAAYQRIRDGLGFRKDPVEFGAFPTDCYSHTPAHAGAQQPGMTGQVKEEVITRLGELGLVLVDGRLELVRPPLPAREIVGPDAGAAYRTTVCGVPVQVMVGDEDVVRVSLADGTHAERIGSALTPSESTEVFGRTGAVSGVRFTTTLLGGA